MSLLTIAAPATRSREGNFLWGVVSIIEVFKSEEERRLGHSLTGEWHWFPTLEAWFADDRFWEKKARGDWQSFFDLTRFNLFEGGPKGRLRMRIEGFPRSAHTFYTKGTGMIVRADGTEVSCTWRLEVAMPEGVPFVR